MNLLKRYLKQKDRIEKKSIKEDIKKIKSILRQGRSEIEFLKYENLEAIKVFLNDKGFWIKTVYRHIFLGVEVNGMDIVIEPKQKR